MSYRGYSASGPCSAASSEGRQPTTFHSILVVNSKGGCGKTTIATNLASYYARLGLPTGLYDCDLQRSSELWLGRRPESAAKVQRLTKWEGRSCGQGLARVIIDAPGGIDIGTLTQQVGHADTVIIPVLPSYIDIPAAAGFIGRLLVKLNLDIATKSVCVVANRIRSNTQSFEKLGRFLHNLRVPFIASLRDGQMFVQAYEHGLGICELPASRVVQDMTQFQQLINWIERPKGETIWARALKPTQRPQQDTQELTAGQQRAASVYSTGLRRNQNQQTASSGPRLFIGQSPIRTA